MGKETEEIIAHKHQDHDLFGAGEDDDDKLWNPVIRQALIAGYLKKEVENYGLLKLTSAGKKYLKHPESFMIVKDNEFTADDDAMPEHEGAAGFTAGSMPMNLFWYSFRRVDMAAAVAVLQATTTMSAPLPRRRSVITLPRSLMNSGDFSPYGQKALSA